MRHGIVKHSRLILSVFALLCTINAAAWAQEYPILDRIAEKVVQKYQQSSCEQLWQQKHEPKPPMEQEAIAKLRANPGMRQEFINRVAGPIANKLFECGMIP